MFKSDKEDIRTLSDALWQSVFSEEQLNKLKGALDNMDTKSRKSTVAFWMTTVIGWGIVALGMITGVYCIFVPGSIIVILGGLTMLYYTSRYDVVRKLHLAVQYDTTFKKVDKHDEN